MLMPSPLPSGAPGAVAAHCWRLNLAGTSGLTPTRAARAWVRGHLSAAGIDYDDAELVADELVGNAERYGGGATWLSMTLTASLLRLSVRDRRPAMLPRPASALPDEDAESGRGLLITEALAETLAVRLCGRRAKRVEAILKPHTADGGI